MHSERSLARLTAELLAVVGAVVLLLAAAAPVVSMARSDGDASYASATAIDPNAVLDASLLADEPLANEPVADESRSAELAGVQSHPKQLLRNAAVGLRSSLGAEPSPAAPTSTPTATPTQIAPLATRASALSSLALDERTEPTAVEAVPAAEPTAVEAGEIEPTATAVPPTATAVPPTATAVEPTATTVPPTATAVPVEPTAVPPIATAVTIAPTAVPPTATPVPPTATPVPPPPVAPTATAVPAVPPAPSASSYEQRGRRVLGQVSFNWQALGYSVSFHPPRAGYRGLTFPYERRIEIYVDPGISDAELAHVIAHEIGHAVDVERNSGDDRQAWLAARGFSASTPWWAGDGVSDFASGSGDFAECFASWQVGSPSYSRLNSSCAGTSSLVARLSSG